MVRFIKNRVFEKANRVASCDIEETIIVAGSPRSGTTWLAELLRELPGYKLISEPLRLSTNPRAKEAGFEWRTHIYPLETRPEARAYLDDVFHGRVELGPSWHFRNSNMLLKLMEHLTHRKAIVKLCRAGRMLHWIAKQFDVRGIVLMMRHPCANIASKLRMGDNWAPSKVDHLPLEKRFGGRIPEEVVNCLRPILDNRQLWVEHLAIRWCLDHYFALREHADGEYPWITTTYRALYTQGESELKRILLELDGEVTEGMLERIDTPSSYASDTLSEKSTRQLSKWKDTLTTQQIDAILNIVEAFGFGSLLDGIVLNHDRNIKANQSDIETSPTPD